MGDSLYKSLRITRTEPELEDEFGDDWLTLSQPDWPEPPTGGFFAWAVDNDKSLSLESVLEYFEIYKSNCAEDGSLEVEIQVRRSRTDLNYAISCSYGELSGKFSGSAEISESITVESESAIDLEQQISDFTAEWEGSVYGEDCSEGAELVTDPDIAVDGSVLSFGQEVTGVLRLTYTEEFDLYYLTIIPRDEGDYDADDIQTAYQSTVFAIWGECEIETMDVNLPDMSGNCNGGSNATVDPDDPDKEKCYDLYEMRDKCTDELLSERLVEVVCPEGEEDT